MFGSTSTPFFSLSEFELRGIMRAGVDLSVDLGVLFFIFFFQSGLIVHNSIQRQHAFPFVRARLGWLERVFVYLCVFLN